MKPIAPKIKDIKSNKLRVLILEDIPADAEMMERQLGKSGFVSFRGGSRARKNSSRH